MEGKYSHFAEIPKEELQEIASRGGVESGKVRREKRTMREQMEALLRSPIMLDKMRDNLEAVGFDSDTPDNAAAIACTLFLKAIEGDYSAIDRILELIGEGGTKRISINTGPTELGDILDQLGNDNGKD